VTVTIALVEVRPGAGEVAANEATILRYARQADRLGAAVTVFPASMLTGVGADDPRAGDGLRRQADEALTRLALGLDREGLGGRRVVVGTTGTGVSDMPTNAAAVLHKGRVALSVTDQTSLSDAVFPAHGLRFGLAVGSAPGQAGPGPGDPDGGDPDGAGRSDSTGRRNADDQDGLAAILVLGDGLAYGAAADGHRISPPAPSHEGLTLWELGSQA
jgi:hypothetical protein